MTSLVVLGQPISVTEALDAIDWLSQARDRMGDAQEPNGIRLYEQTLLDYAYHGIAQTLKGLPLKRGTP